MMRRRLRCTGLLLTLTTVGLCSQAQTSIEPAQNTIAVQESVVGPGSESAAPVLTLQDAIAGARLHQPDLRLAAARVQAAEARVDEARAAFYPQISLSGILKAGLPGSTGALGLIGFPSTPFFRNIAGSLNIQQTIFDFGRLRHTLNAAKLLEQATVLQQTAAERAAALLVARAYHLALSAQTMRAIAENNMALQRLDRDEALAYARAGLHSQYDADVAGERLAQAQEAATQSFQAEIAAKAALRSAMGEPDISAPMTLVPPVPRTPPGPLPATVAEGMAVARRQRPELQAEALEASALAQQLELARADRLPQVSGFGAAGGGRFNDATVKPQQQHGVAAVGASLPVFDGGMRKARIREAMAATESEKARGEQLRETIAGEVNDAILQNASTTTTLATLRQQEVLAEEELKGVSEQAKAELVSLAVRDRAELRLRELRAQVAMVQLTNDEVQFELEFSLGGNLDL
ncbi:MAG: TolC family protein [Acidobacteriota bacterium]|nr:TolC family protein [Acidobacteriota bacterium]